MLAKTVAQLNGDEQEEFAGDLRVNLERQSTFTCQ